jgi:aromatic-L-amino-acid decarboxylase
MFTNFDCSVYFVKNADNLIRTLEVLPEYLKTGTRGSVKDYRDWSVPLGRRFRALKLWFVMRSYGLEGIRKKLSYHIELNRYFSEKISQSNGFELAVEPFLNFTAFRLNPSGSSDPKMVNPLNERLQDEINRNGRLFLTHTKISGLHTLRMVIGQTYVEQMHVKLALDEIVSVAERIRQDPSPGNDEP